MCMSMYLFNPDVTSEKGSQPLKDALLLHGIINKMALEFSYHWHFGYNASKEETPCDLLMDLFSSPKLWRTVVCLQSYCVAFSILLTEIRIFSWVKYLGVCHHALHCTILLYVFIFLGFFFSSVAGDSSSHKWNLRVKGFGIFFVCGFFE